MRRFPTLMILAVVLAANVGVLRAQEASVPGTYVHPVRKFSFAVPPDATIAETGQGGGLSIRSRKGYIVNIQTGASSPHVDLSAMLGRLEAQYLGRDRPWNAKLGEGETRAGGLPAREAVYDGQTTRARVVIARGAKTDFVFMFFAPPAGFANLSKEFSGLLSTFRPADNELIAAPAPMTPAPAPSAPAPPAAPVEPVVRQPVIPSDGKRFSDSNLGYVVDYPAEWEFFRPTAFAVVFGGQKGTPAYDLVVSIQNVKPPAAMSPNEAAQQVYNNLKAQLAPERFQTAYFGEGPYVHENPRQRLKGYQFLVNYTDGERRYKQLTIVLPRPDSAVAYIWTYRAPQERFHSYLPIAQNMLRSWSMLPARGS